MIPICRRAFSIVGQQRVSDQKLLIETHFTRHFFDVEPIKLDDLAAFHLGIAGCFCNKDNLDMAFECAGAVERYIVEHETSFLAYLAAKRCLGLLTEIQESARHAPARDGAQHVIEE